MNESIITVIVAIFASGGFWAFLQNWLLNRGKAKSNEQRLIMGLAFRQIIELCEYYLGRGYIYADEYKELNHYLFEPYAANGGDGTAARLFDEVKKLPIRNREEYHE